MLIAQFQESFFFVFFDMALYVSNGQKYEVES